jgi:hypothetical protein
MGDTCASLSPAHAHCSRPTGVSTNCRCTLANAPRPPPARRCSWPLLQGPSAADMASAAAPPGALHAELWDEREGTLLAAQPPPLPPPLVRTAGLAVGRLWGRFGTDRATILGAIVTFSAHVLVTVGICFGIEWGGGGGFGMCQEGVSGGQMGLAAAQLQRVGYGGAQHPV